MRDTSRLVLVLFSASLGKFSGDLLVFLEQNNRANEILYFIGSLMLTLSLYLFIVNNLYLHKKACVKKTLNSYTKQEQTKEWFKVVKETMKFLNKLISGKRGAMTTQQVIGIAISLFLLAVLFPLAMIEIVGANTTAWNASVTTIFQTVLPILATIGVAVAYIKTK